MLYSATISEKGSPSTLETGECFDGEMQHWINKAKRLANKDEKVIIVTFRPREQSFEVYPDDKDVSAEHPKVADMLSDAGKEFKDQLILDPAAEALESGN